MNKTPLSWTVWDVQTHQHVEVTLDPPDYSEQLVFPWVPRDVFYFATYGYAMAIVLILWWRHNRKPEPFSIGTPALDDVYPPGRNRYHGD